MWNDYEDDEYDDGSLGSLMLRARAGKPNLEKQIQDEAAGLMADEAAAKSWHPPMAMPNTPRDPDKERREKEAMKAFLANGGGPAYGRRKSPMASVPPSQNPFSKPTPSDAEMSRVNGATMASQLPPAQGVQDVQRASFGAPAGFPRNPFDRPPMGPERPPMGGSNSGQSAESGEGSSISFDLPEGFPKNPMNQAMGPERPEQSAPDDLRQMLMRLNETYDDGLRKSESNLDDRMSAVSQQNANLDFMKLLMRNAAQMGQIGGKVASTQAFDDNIDSMQGRNTQAEQRYISTLKDSKARLDDRKKTLLALLKMDQDAALRREGFDVQRDNNEAMRNYRQDMLDATSGQFAAKHGLDTQKLEATIKDLESKGELAKLGYALDKLKAEGSLNNQSASLTETNRHNVAMEGIAKEKAEYEKKKNKQKAKSASQGAAKTEMFRKRMANADKAYSELMKQGYDPTNTMDAVASSVPFVGNSLVSKNKQLDEQLRQEFVQATLRDESGATIGTDEYIKNMKKYFPVWGDSKETIERKRRLRQADIKTLAESYASQMGEANALMGIEDDEEIQPPTSGRRIINNFDDL